MTQEDIIEKEEIRIAYLTRLIKRAYNSISWHNCEKIANEVYKEEQKEIKAGIKEAISCPEKFGMFTESELLEAYYDGFNQAHYSWVHPDICPPKECEAAGIEWLSKKKLNKSKQD